MSIIAPGLAAFLSESLTIEGVHRAPTREELDATHSFLISTYTAILTVDAVCALQAVYTPGKPLRDKPGMDVRVAAYLPPGGSTQMRSLLEDVLSIPDPLANHVHFQLLHPFMDGNGRTGRAVWAWKMLNRGQDPFALPFLHRFYYQTLASAG